MTLQALQAGLLRSPELRSAYEVLRAIPGLGSALQGAAERVFPSDSDLVVRVPAGIAEGMSIQLDPRFHTEQARGSYESSMQQLLAGLLRPGDFFCDVGAQIGFFTLGAARLVGESGRVVALEPDPMNYRRLARSIELNGLIRVRKLNLAACSSDGEPQGLSAVRRAPLDEVVGKPPDVIKVDVEGGEAEVLRGARGLLHKHRSSWVIEAHGAERLSEVVALLSGFGYAPRVAMEEASPERGDRYFVVARP